MSDQFWLTKAQLKRIEPVFPRTRGIPRPACVTGIVHVIRTAMAMAEGHACESACGGLPSNPQHKFFCDFLRSLVRTTSIRVARRICLVSISAVSGRSTA
jgi:hypothetical protein